MTREIDVLILMGSASDWERVRPATAVLDELEIRYDVRVSSAHRTPERTVELVRDAEERGCAVVICAAGMAAHLAGVVAAHTLRPVIGIPLPGGVLDGVDALLSTVQMPPGVPVATVSVGSAGARNAAFFAARILAVSDPRIRESLTEQQALAAAKVERTDGEIQAELGRA